MSMNEAKIISEIERLEYVARRNTVLAQDARTMEQAESYWDAVDRDRKRADRLREDLVS